MSENKTVKLQLLGLYGDNRNVVLTKDLTIANAFDGHFEVDELTAKTLYKKFNVNGEELIVEEGHPKYSKPIVNTVAKLETVEEVKDAMCKIEAEKEMLEEEIAVLKAEIEDLKTENEVLKSEKKSAGAPPPAPATTGAKDGDPKSSNKK